MNLKAPQGSTIETKLDDGYWKILIPKKPRGPASIGVVLFMIFWLGGWAIGWRDVSGQISAGKGNAFLVFWLCAWTIGGVFAAYQVVLLLRPSVPESLTLKPTAIGYDSGIAPADMSTTYRKSWSDAFPRRTRIEIGKESLPSLRLRNTEAASRLTVDVGVNRIEIAAAATEVEREWLYAMLRDFYRIPTVPTQSG